MKKLFAIAAISSMAIWALGQDTYHTNLLSGLQTNYGLPAGTWVLNNTESANLNADYWWGDINASNQSIADQPFSQKVQIAINSAGTNQWDAGYGIHNIQQISSGSACLLVIWLRTPSSPAQVSLFVENTSTYEKEVYLTFDLTEQWTQFLIPFDANQTYAADGLSVGLHLAWLQQSVEIGGLAVLNYGTSLSIDDLPNQTNNDQYGGWEIDAPWRAAAAERIEQLRKANLTIKVQNADGSPIPGALVEVEMLRHEYAFGSAVVSRLFAGNNGQNNTYETKLLDLDGEGHGFNWVVFENALKWPGWEQNWITSKPETANAVQWLRDHDIQIRGHNLVWPGWSNLPPDIEDHQDDPAYIENRIFNHIEEITTYPGIEGNIAEWDVLNEITTNRDLEYALQGQPGYVTGREIYVKIFEKLAEVDPNTKTYINDYVTISQANTGGGLYDLKKQFAQELIDAGVQLDGIGFQGHIGGFPTSIYDVKSILDDFYTTFGTTAKITEYDTNEAIDDELAATYLRDFLTLVFSHPSTDGFMMWGFWDGAHWHGNAPMFYQDWTLKPAGSAFIDLVYNDWWTEESGMTDANGTYSLRGFKGAYKITIDCGNELLVDTIELKHNTILTKLGSDVSVGVDHLDQSSDVVIYPNPADTFFIIEKNGRYPLLVRIYDSSGKEVYVSQLMADKTTIPVTFAPGTYEVLIESQGKLIRTEKMVIQR
ncbi:MAG TPA: endo-1,4-beta-xylanase [Saprospiraceae bacterium]|nr:endo-1,4-beta-xylanase [Saprospiraceae bacterium]HMQ84033.1 endo-1,4-beta-xylanase [Saprospiraceae bacterium]